MHPDTDWLDYPADDDTPTPLPPSKEQAAHARRLRERRAALEERWLVAALEGEGLATCCTPLGDINGTPSQY
ncbi:hypothetical protein [Leeia aquatica]|uniref:Uncharacterized protein n=1 Tax=Leeia aquatica TaxID=2725557 RepID=A0A847RSZ5_9NEIS|nr:hypothetical protein [Leeia aquatica]NLR74330.1 hypothetical protein [Leeia aquatica]